METPEDAAAAAENQLQATRRLTAYRLAAVFWMVLIFILSSQSRIPGPSLFWGQDKVAHFLAFGILGYLCARALPGLAGTRNGLQVLVLALLIAFYGVIDEIHQAFVPGRDAALADVLADGLGGLVGVLLARRSR